MLVQNKNSKIKVDVGTMPISKINGFSNLLSDYVNGNFTPDFEPNVWCRYIQANKLGRQQKSQIKDMIRENEIREVVNSILEEKSQGGEE